MTEDAGEFLRSLKTVLTVAAFVTGVLSVRLLAWLATDWVSRRDRRRRLEELLKDTDRPHVGDRDE